MSKIYLAQDLLSKQQVVIKQPNVKADGSLSHIKVKSLEREASSLKLIDHPNVVRYIDSGYDIDAFYLAIQYIHAQSMLELYNKKPPPSLLAREYMLQLLEVLTYLHNKNVVHQDIKPGNLLIGDTLTLIDFGTSHKTDEHPPGPEKVGTPGYQCPELFQRNISLGCDVFSAGATLFFLIIGTRPPDSSWEINSNSNDSKREALLIAKNAMERDVALRYSNVIEMKQDLLKTQSGVTAPALFTKGRFFEIKTTSLIGREHSLDIHIEDSKRFLSPIHAEITVDGPDTWLEDRSLNGTFVYNQEHGYERIKKRKLTDGDIIVLCYNQERGPYRQLKFRAGQDPRG